GFRAGEVRNRGILASRGDYFIFLDGDCIPRRNLVAVHRQLAEPGWFVTGNRVLMSRELTEQVLAQRSEIEHWSVRDWIALRRRGKIDRLAPLWGWRLGPLGRLRQGAGRGAGSCNLEVWEGDIERVVGSDASSRGGGLEDPALLTRLCARA